VDSAETPSLPHLTLRRVFQTWWPLAASWLLMATDQPAMSAIVARLADPEINLAAWGGVVFPLALIIEAPIIMLLSASTALCKDWDSYWKVFRFMMAAGAVLTGVHVLIAFTPLYFVVVRGVIGAPEEIVGPARTGLMLMTPWTWAIAFRRFNQGVLIRFGHSRAVGIGTVLRLVTNGLVLAIGYAVGTIPGIAVAGAAIAMGVLSEAIYAGLRVRPVLREQVRNAPPVECPLTLRSFLAFYVPLALTSLLLLLVQPIGSMALSRMRDPLTSLAVWPVATSLLFLVRSLGLAFNEVVVALMGEPGAVKALRRFAGRLLSLTTALYLLIVATPLAGLWLGGISALSAPLAQLGGRALWLALPIPALTVLQSLFQGGLVHAGRTRGIIEAMAIFLSATTAVLWGAVVWGQQAGLYYALVAFTIGALMQTLWLWFRSRSVVSPA
jgi:hypothetical protein